MRDQKELKVVGVSLPRVDGVQKVRGRAVYAPDFVLPRMLYAKVLWSDRPHAKIVRLDASKALQVPGVVVFVSAEDAPRNRYGVYLKDQLVFARGKVRHIGEPVAALAAESEQAALEALKLVEVVYEDLPVVFDPLEAMQDGAPIVHPDLESYSATYPKVAYGNVALYTRLSIGDTEKGFAEADHIFEDEFKTQAMYQGYVEPRACVAGFDQRDKLTVWTSNQQIAECHAELAAALDVPMTDVRVVGTALGGGFGGKLKTHLEPIAALLAKKTGRAVKIVLTREEDMIASRARPPYIIRLKTGVTNEGRITARETQLVSDCGGYSDHVVGTMGLAVTFAQGAYKIPNCEVKGYVVYTNNPNYSCMRGYGAHQIDFANESQMDMIASRMGWDPVEFRRENLIEDGDVLVSTQPIKEVTIKETMDVALERSKWVEKVKQEKVLGDKVRYGIGIGNTIINMGLLSSSAMIKFNGDGTATILTSVMDLGTGNHTALIQIAAEELGMLAEQVNIAEVDSDSSPYDLGQIASRTIFDAGNAVRLAAKDARKKLFETAAELLQVPEEDLESESGMIFSRTDRSKEIAIAGVNGYRIWVKGGPVVGGSGWLGRPGFEEEVGEGYPQAPSKTFVFGTHIAEVEVDIETGRVTVVKVTAVHDVGRAVNPLGVQGQIEGGVVQGVGYALMEELQVKDGVILNPDFLNYRMPTTLDIPEIDPVILEIPSEFGPFGAKGLGEPVMMGVVPAIANAIENAIGVRVTEVPITAERLLQAVKEKNQRK
ncbi:MAG: xanthine dehydrogenase family protein molybdopterin-binding subunit [Anaerolineales bacterium]|nr:xanthine dehydrogenase family protein molybdopterin-binding subunit [Anaerolineales bacterium]